MFYLGKGKIFLAPKINRRKPILKITIVPPAGKFNKKAKMIPQMTDKVEKHAAARIVILKLMDSCRAVSGGNNQQCGNQHYAL